MYIFFETTNRGFQPRNRTNSENRRLGCRTRLCHADDAAVIRADRSWRSSEGSRGPTVASSAAATRPNSYWIIPYRKVLVRLDSFFWKWTEIEALLLVQFSMDSGFAMRQTAMMDNDMDSTSVEDKGGVGGNNNYRCHHLVASSSLLGEPIGPPKWPRISSFLLITRKDISSHLQSPRPAH